MAARLVPPLVLAYLVQTVPPDAIGVVAAGMIVIGFSQVFCDAGLSKALVQTRQPEHVAATIVFWTNIGVALVLYAILAWSAPAVAERFGDARLITVLRLSGLQLLALAASAAFIALQQRRMNFKSLFIARTCSAVCNGAVSIAIVTLGGGYLALVGGAIAGSLGQLLVLVATTSWRPAWRYDLLAAAELARFGRWAMLTGFLAWFYVSGDSLIVALHLPSAELGIYNVGLSLVNLTFGLAVAPLLPVLYSVLSKMQDSPAAIRAAVLKSTRLIAHIVVPLAVLLALGRHVAGSTLFPATWAGVERVICVMALGAAISWLVSANSEAYRAIGRPDIEAKIMAGCCMVYFPVYLLAVKYGLLTFILWRGALAVFGFLVHLSFARLYLGLSWRTYVDATRVPVVAALIAWTCAEALARTASVSNVTTGLGAVAMAMFVALYCGLLALLDRDFALREVRTILRSMIGR